MSNSSRRLSRGDRRRNNRLAAGRRRGVLRDHRRDADQVALQDGIRYQTAALDRGGTVTLDASGGFGSAVEVIVTADDPTDLQRAGKAVLQAVSALEGART